MDESRVLLDSDFCNMLTEIDSEKIDSRKLVESVFSVIGKVPYIHEYVVDEELFGNQIVQEFVKNRKIKKLEYAEITQNWKNKQQYEETFAEYFYSMNEEYFLPEKFCGDCFSFRKEKLNLGEIHSIIAARFLKIPLFYSNDNGARYLARKYDTRDSVVKLVSGLDLMIECKDLNVFDRNTRRAIFAKYKTARWKERYSEMVKTGGWTDL